MKIYVIGAGIIGISCAISLQKDGHQVVLIDKNGPCSGASYGNAGAIVNGSCVPTSTPGIIFNFLKMMGSKGPLSIRPFYFPILLPWLLRFLNESRTVRFHQNAQNLHALTNRAADSWLRILKHTDCADLFNQSGWLKVYENHETFKATILARQMMTELGTPFEILCSDEIHDLEPGLNRLFKYGIFQRDAYFITNPDKMIKSLAENFVANGGEIKIAEVTLINVKGQRPILKTSHGVFYPDKLVIAAGAWSKILTRELGFKMPLEAERGYHLMLPSVPTLSRPVVHGERLFVLCPMETGLRVTSQVEFAGLDAKPDLNKIRALLPDVKRMLPDAIIDEKSNWLGFRPSLPDSLPVISGSKHNDIYYAFGHQHLGMTTGPITGQIIADLIADRTPKIDITPYRADRF